jgi:hypothetical protein
LNQVAGSLILYVLEYNETDSAVVKYELTRDYIGALKLKAAEK